MLPELVDWFESFHVGYDDPSRGTRTPSFSRKPVPGVPGEIDITHGVEHNLVRGNKSSQRVAIAVSSVEKTLTAGRSLLRTAR